MTRSGLSHKSSDDEFSAEEAESVPPLPPIDDKPITAAREEALQQITSTSQGTYEADLSRILAEIYQARLCLFVE